MTVKQRLFFKELLTGKSAVAAARNAGYSPNSARISAYVNMSKYEEFWLSLLVEADIDIGSLARNLKKGLASKDERLKFQYTKLMLEMIDRMMQSEHFAKVTEQPINFSEEARKRMEKYL